MNKQDLIEAILANKEAALNPRLLLAALSTLFLTPSLLASRRTATFS